ncbi:MAG: hypothetical protein ACJA1Z_000776 [Patiriisocius sp.]|jgi:hypothetical protein
MYKNNKVIIHNRESFELEILSTHSPLFFAQIVRWLLAIKIRVTRTFF